MSLHLLHLPFELLRACASELSSHDLRSLRLVCRQLDQVAFDLLGPRDFTRITTDLGRISLQRLQDISKAVHVNCCAVHVNCCVKNLRIVYEFPSTRVWTTTEKFVEDICWGNTRFNLETLELDYVSMTLKVFRDLLFSSSNSLHTLSIKNTWLIGGKWTSVFKYMVGKLPHLRNITLNHPFQSENDDAVWFGCRFSPLTEYPVEPGSESYAYNRRISKALLHPIEFHYRHGSMDIDKIVYSGPDVDQFLLILVDIA